MPLERLIIVIILGVIQGLTEWFPISSTGHLRLVELYLNLKAPILFDVALHVGTLTVILLFFKEDVKDVLSALASLNFKTEGGRLIPLIAIGSIPTALIGLALSELVEAAFRGILPIAASFLICGALLYSSKVRKEATGDVSYLKALVIGVAQGVAVIPGISRSGTTIAVALLTGVGREKAFKFSFLLSVPAVLGALGLTVYEQLNELLAAGLGLIEVLVGIVVAAFVGYLALRTLWTILAKRRFHLFAFYCWLLGVALMMLMFAMP